MLVLGIDSSASAASVALLDGERLLGEFFVNTKQTHSQTLLPMAEALLSSLGKKCEDLDLIAVSQGPGSFTGVRIGVSCAKGLAFPHDTPCCGVSTLEAIAYGGIACEGSLLCAVMDARCGQVYNALFLAENGLIKRITEDRAIAVEALVEECCEYGKRVILLGDGAKLCHDTFKNQGAMLAPASIRFQRASSVAFVAMNHGEFIPARQLNPFYLRPPQAERELKRKQEGKMI